MLWDCGQEFKRKEWMMEPLLNFYFLQWVPALIPNCSPAFFQRCTCSGFLLNFGALCTWSILYTLDLNFYASQKSGNWIQLSFILGYCLQTMPKVFFTFVIFWEITHPIHFLWSKQTFWTNIKTSDQDASFKLSKSDGLWQSIACRECIFEAKLNHCSLCCDNFTSWEPSADLCYYFKLQLQVWNLGVTSLHLWIFILFSDIILVSKFCIIRDIYPQNFTWNWFS